jgi:glycine/D-amino acid oxidase-like deaminating enzyme
MEFLRERIPEMARGRVVGSRTCLYASTPDDHFIIDYVPGSSRVLVSGGGSGHGFKFGASMGQVIADALEERHNPLGDRFRLRDRLAVKAAARPEESRGFARPTT